MCESYLLNCCLKSENYFAHEQQQTKQISVHDVYFFDRGSNEKIFEAIFLLMSKNKYNNSCLITFC